MGLAMTFAFQGFQGAFDAHVAGAAERYQVVPFIGAAQTQRFAVMDFGSRRYPFFFHAVFAQGLAAQLHAPQTQPATPAIFALRGVRISALGLGHAFVDLSASPAYAVVYEAGTRDTVAGLSLLHAEYTNTMVNWVKRILGWADVFGPRFENYGKTVETGSFFRQAIQNQYDPYCTPAVYAAVNILASTIASLPLQVLRYEDEDDRHPDTANPLYRLLKDAPNPEMTSYEWIEMLVTSLYLTGNAYAYVDWQRGKPTAIWPIEASQVRIDRDANTDDLIYEVSRLRDRPVNLMLSRREMFHVKLPGDDKMGFSPIRLHAGTFQMERTQEQYAEYFYANSQRPGDVLEHPGVLSKEAQERIKESWKSDHGGPQQANRAMILEEGMKHVAIKMPELDKSLIEARYYSLGQISIIFGIPVYMLADHRHSTYTNIGEQYRGFIRDSIRPKIVRIEKALERTFLLHAHYGRKAIRFNLSGVLRGEEFDRWRKYRIGTEIGVFSQNEIRKMEDMNKIPDGDEHEKALNLTRDDEAENSREDTDESGSY